jgi:hypothetical protein
MGATERHLSLAGLVSGTLGMTNGEFISLCRQPPGGAFSSEVIAAADVAARAPAPDLCCSWFGVNPTAGPARPPGSRRGTERDVTKWVTAYADLDVKPGAFTSLEQAAKFITEASALIGQRPSAVIHSGHGLQPLWPIEDAPLDTDEKWARAYRLSRRFGRLLQLVADKQFGGTKLDTVSDMSRVLRCPDTINWKDHRHPVSTFAEPDIGGPLDLAALEDVLDQWVPALASDDPVSGIVLAPPADWCYGQSTCSYVRKMIDALSIDKPAAGRHQWAMDRAVRLAAAHRLGCVTETDLQAALATLQAALKYWCQTVGTPRDLHPGEIRSAYNWAQNKVATFDDGRTKGELNDHKHLFLWAPTGGGYTTFWESTDVLKHIHATARAQMAGPWATLGCAQARITAHMPPTVVLPSYVGRHASLNIYIGLIGESGDGKGLPAGAAEDAFFWPGNGIYSTGIGSGEGINHLFAHWDPKTKKTVMDRDRVLFEVPEVDILGALAGRNGSTLLPQLRKAFSGEALTFAYVDRMKSLDIPAHTYRLSLIVGVQPKRAGILLDDADGGTPQRFLWLPVLDSGMTAADLSAPVPLMRLSSLDLSAGIIGFPDRARKEVREARAKRGRGEKVDSTLDGHLPLCRMKTAASLALLHGERDVTDLYWDLSEDEMKVSLETRDQVQESLARQASERNRAAGRADGERAVAAKIVHSRAEAAIQRVSRNIMAWLKKTTKNEGPSALVRKGIASRDREYFDTAVDRLVGAGQLEVEDTGNNGRTLRLLTGP